MFISYILLYLTDLLTTATCAEQNKKILSEVKVKVKLGYIIVHFKA